MEMSRTSCKICLSSFCLTISPHALGSEKLRLLQDADAICFVYSHLSNLLTYNTDFVAFSLDYEPAF